MINKLHDYLRDSKVRSRFQVEVYLSELCWPIRSESPETNHVKKQVGNTESLKVHKVCFIHKLQEQNM